MREHKETLKSILKELVDKYGLDETIDYVAGIAEDIDFENFKKEKRLEELNREMEEDELEM